MKVSLVGIGPDISTVREHIEPGLRRARFNVDPENGLVAGAGTLDLSIIFRSADNLSLRDAEALARQAAAQFLREAAEAIENE